MIALRLELAAYATADAGLRPCALAGAGELRIEGTTTDAVRFTNALANRLRVEAGEPTTSLVYDALATGRREDEAGIHWPDVELV